jgi:hypothetical protein
MRRTGTSDRDLYKTGLVDERAPDGYEAALGGLLDPKTDHDRADIEFGVPAAHGRASTRFEGYVGLRSAIDDTFEGGRARRRRERAVREGRPDGRSRAYPRTRVSVRVRARSEGRGTA